MADSKDTKFPPTYGYFSTPVYRGIAGHGEQLEPLKKLLLSKETSDFEHPNSPQESHPGVFESRFDFFAWPDKDITQLKNRIYVHLMQYLRDVNGFDEEALKKYSFVQKVGAISRAEEAISKHTHILWHR